MKAGWRDAPLALWDSVVSNMQKSSFRILGLTFFSKLDWGSYIISNAKTTSSENWSLDSFYEVSVIALYLPYGHAWNTIAMSGLMLLVATWNCWINYKNRHEGLAAIHLLLIAEM